MSHILIEKPLNLSRRAVYRLEKWMYTQNWLSTSQLSFPDFMCIGSQKAGTTWLYENLRCHTQLFLPARKELNYFSSKYRFYGLPLKAYSDYFDGAEGVKGEVTPCANISIKRIRFIKKMMPSLKLILIMRNPVDRMWAAALMYLVRARGRSFESLTDDDFIKLFSNKDLYDRGDYPRILSNWRKVFPSEQIHLCFYDNLVNDPESFLRSILQFLNVDATIDLSNFPLTSKINKSPDFEIPAHLKTYLTNMYRDSMMTLEKEFPQISKQWKY